MTTYVDTSAFIALLDSDAREHPRAGKIWIKLLEQDERLVTSSYVVVETCALLQRRIGLPAVRKFLEDTLPVVMVEWIDLSAYDAGIGTGGHGILHHLTRQYLGLSTPTFRDLGLALGRFYAVENSCLLPMSAGPVGWSAFLRTGISIGAQLGRYAMSRWPGTQTS